MRQCGGVLHKYITKEWIMLARNKHVYGNYDYSAVNYMMM